MPKRILIVKLSSLGDIVHTLPAARAIRTTFPDAHLGWAVERAHAEVLDHQTWLDERIEWNRGARGGLWRFVRDLRKTYWDVAIDFQGLLRSGLATRASGANLRFGYSPAREWAPWCINRRVPLETMERHAVERSWLLAQAVIERLHGAKAAAPVAWASAHERLARLRETPGRALFSLQPGDQAAMAARKFLDEHGFRESSDRLVVLNPHCRKDANRWPASRYIELARRLLEMSNTRVVLTGGNAAKSLCDEIAAPLGNGVWRADGRLRLLESAGLYAWASVFVTGDTGPMHLAAAMETPIVALFGPANPTRTGPYSRTAITIRKKIECSPCFARSGCPLGHDPPLCMDLIEVNEVFAEIQRIIDSRSDGSWRRSA